MRCAWQDKLLVVNVSVYLFRPPRLRVFNPPLREFEPSFLVVSLVRDAALARACPHLCCCAHMPGQPIHAWHLRWLAEGALVCECLLRLLVDVGPRHQPLVICKFCQLHASSACHLHQISWQLAWATTVLTGTALIRPTGHCTIHSRLAWATLTRPASSLL